MSLWILFFKINNLLNLHFPEHFLDVVVDFAFGDLLFFDVVHLLGSGRDYFEVGFLFGFRHWEVNDWFVENFVVGVVEPVGWDLFLFVPFFN